MSIKLDSESLDWIQYEYQSGRTIEEISVDTGMSKQNVKRALAEQGELSLSWYKTVEENNMMNYLKSKDITNVKQLISALGNTPTESTRIIKALLDRGEESVHCWVSDFFEKPDCTDIQEEIVKCNPDSEYPFYDGDLHWKYATPYDPVTDLPITELPK